MPKKLPLRTASNCTGSKIRIHGVHLNSNIVQFLFQTNQLFMKWKLARLSIWSLTANVMSFDATNTLGVMLGKKPNQYQFTSSQSVPSLPNLEPMMFITNLWKTKLLEISTLPFWRFVDSWMSICPTMISGNECNTNQEQIGNECFNFNIFQFDSFLVKLNSS